jgi:hypothetical protein
MNDRIRHVLTRRASLASLGGAALTTLVSQRPAGSKKRRTSTTAKARKRCQTQSGQCVTLLATTCQADTATCLRAQIECCPIAGRCDLTGFFNCLAVVQA